MQDHFKQLNTKLATHFTSKGQTYLYFGGTAYLGIPQNEDFIQHYIKGIKKYGLNNGTSRNNNVQQGIYDEVEHFAAHKFGSAAALITSSGYLAAQLTVKLISTFGKVRYAPGTHPALWVEAAPTSVGSFIDWSTQLVEEINKSEQLEWVIISNSMNNLYPEIYDFSFLKEIANEKKLFLVVDDSHGIGINNKGLSASSAIPTLTNLETVIVASMAKALGVNAGIVLGPDRIIQDLKSTNEFLGASPPSAAGLYAFMQGNEIYNTTLKKLKKNTARLAEFLKGSNKWHFIPEFPVFFYKNADLSEKLFKQNVIVSSFPYPDKDGEVINRIVLSSSHSDQDIDKLIAILERP